MTFGWLLFSLGFVVVVSVLVWVKKAHANHCHVKDEIIKRLGGYADKDHLITNSLIKEARKTLKSGNDFEVVYQPQASVSTQNRPSMITSKPANEK